MDTIQGHDDVLYRHSGAIDRFEEAHVTKAFFLKGGEGFLPSNTYANGDDHNLDGHPKAIGTTTAKSVRADVKNSMMTLCLGNEEKELKQIESKAYREFVLNELPIFETKHHEFKMRHRSYGISEADGTAKGESFLARKSPKKSPKPPPYMTMSSTRSPRKSMTTSSVFTEEHDGESHYDSEHPPEVESAAASVKDALKKFKKLNKKKRSKNRMINRRLVVGPTTIKQLEQEQQQLLIQQQIQQQQDQNLNTMPSIEKSKQNKHGTQSPFPSPTQKEQHQRFHQPMPLKIKTHVPNLNDKKPEDDDHEDEKVPSVIDEEANFQNHVRKMKEAFASFLAQRHKRNELNAHLAESMETEPTIVPTSDGHLKNTIQRAMTKKFTDLNQQTVKQINFPMQLFGSTTSKSKQEGSLEMNPLTSAHMFNTWQDTMRSTYESSNVRMRREMHMDDLEEMSEWGNNESFAKPLKRNHADTTEAAAQKLMRECLENAREAQTNLSRMIATEYSLLFDGFTEMDINKDSTLSAEDIQSFCKSYKCSKVLQIQDIETMIWNYDDYRRGSISFHDVQQGYSLIREEMIELVSNHTNLKYVYDDEQKYLKNTDVEIPFRRQSYSWQLPRILLFVALMDESGIVNLLSAYQKLIESLSSNASFMFKFIFARDDVFIKDSDMLTIKQFLKETKKLESHRLKSRPLGEVERRFLYEHQLKNSPHKIKT